MKRARGAATWSRPDDPLLSIMARNLPLPGHAGAKPSTPRGVETRTRFSALPVFRVRAYPRQRSHASTPRGRLMQCPACRHENPAQAKFCLECGARLVVTCPNCRTELPPSAKFCLECGERLTPSGPVIVSPSASPEAYTPKHLAERILTAKAALEGERK